MGVQHAAAYVGEETCDSFLKRVGSEYPRPVIDQGTGKGRRRLWLKADLDRAIGAIGADGPGAFVEEEVDMDAPLPGRRRRR